jgi:hypothetical protein
MKKDANEFQHQDFFEAVKNSVGLVAIFFSSLKSNRLSIPFSFFFRLAIVEYKNASLWIVVHKNVTCPIK